MSDTEFAYESDQDVSESHSKLVQAVAELDKGQRVKKPERSEPSLEVSEFNLVKSGISDRDAVHVNDLAKALGKKGNQFEITKKLESSKKKTRILSKPLEKPAADRIKRIVGFENTQTELKKWNAIITKNRTATSVQFPLNQPSMRLEPTNQFVKRFRIQSDLEKELAALEPQKENIDKQIDEFSLTMKEVMMQRKEAAKLRAQQSYKEAKARRQNKIKSKKFHRVQRKEKVKLQLKEFEELKKTDPEAALEKLQELDKTRAEERMSLRHKSTGQWAQNKQIRAKYDKETRQELSRQLSIGRELTQKVKNPNDSEDENENDNGPLKLSVSDKENPWVGSCKTESEIDEFIEGYRQYWDKRNAQSKTETATKSEASNSPTKTVKPAVHFAFDRDSGSSSPMQNSEEVKEETKSKNETVTRQANGVSKGKPKVISDMLVSMPFRKMIVGQKPKSANKPLASPVATTAWDVEAVQVENLPNRLNTEKINDMFDSFEERIQDEVELKLQIVQNKYEQLTKKTKRKTKSRNRTDDDQFDGLEIQSKRQKPSFDLPLDETSGLNNSRSDESNKLRSVESNISAAVATRNKSDVEIDPNKYINVKPKQLHTNLPDIVTGGDDALDDSENEQEIHNVISEAFADDDVVEEFRKEKEDEVKKSQPKDIDLTLPGWGSWAGKNIRVSKRKRRRFILKFPKEAPRKDENKGDVIIIEENKPKIREHQVSDLPYPFTSVKDFEASVRMPLGRNFVPENSHRKLIQPAVKTTMGRIIEPMAGDVLVKMPERKGKKAAIKKKHSTNNKKKIPKRKQPVE